MHLSKFFETFSLRTSFTPKFTELLEKGSDSILKDNPLSNIISRIENNIPKHIDISSPTIKPFTFAGSELLTKAETWILIIYYYLHKHNKQQETFLYLLQQVNMYRVSGKQKLKRYVFKCCKELFTKQEAISVINANPLCVRKLKGNEREDEVEKMFKYFLVNPKFFEEQTAETQLNVLMNGVYYYEKKGKENKQRSCNVVEESEDESEEVKKSKELERKRKRKMKRKERKAKEKEKEKEKERLMTVKLKKKIKKQKTIRLRKHIKRRNRNKSRNKNLRKRSMNNDNDNNNSNDNSINDDQNVETECIELLNTTSTTPNPNNDNNNPTKPTKPNITTTTTPITIDQPSSIISPCTITHMELTI